MLKNATLKGLAALLACFISLATFAQNYTASETKSIEKSKTYYNKGKYDKAVSTITKVQMNHIYNEDLWTLRCLYEYQRYTVQFSKDILDIYQKASKGGNVNVNFDKLKSTQYRGEMIFACYMATLYAPHQNLASSILHEQIVEPSVDTLVGDAAKELKSKGDDERNNQNYTAAIRQYEKAVKEDSNYYRATYNIGYCYYKDEKYEKAAPWFIKASKLQPEMLDPRYYLVECYMNLKDWNKAYDACVEGIVWYPYASYFTKLEEICEKTGKTFKSHWMSRDYLPNDMTISSQSKPEKEPWSYYREAKDKMGDYCNDEGIIKKSQTLTEQKYLETYSWEYMLKKSDTDDKEFGFARKMKDAGYLDCFVMVSMFHISFIEQYQDFRDNNMDRIRSYIKNELTKQ